MVYTYFPLLSIVATARNDNHGGDLLQRMQIFINGILAQSEKYQVPVELILVEWNPPPDKPKLAQALLWPEGYSFCTIRIIEVPFKIHARYQHAANLPLYQMIGKNVGIRRARGQYILVTNIDILFSDEIFAYFSIGKLEKGKIYRIDRYDVKKDIPSNINIEKQLNYCMNNVIRINEKQGTFDPSTNKYHSICQHDEDEWIPIYTNACGDFQLMHQEHWHQLRGYAEFDMYSFYLDAILEYSAYYSGLEEIQLKDPFRIYHIEHAMGSGWTPEGKEILNNRLKNANIPQVINNERLILKYIMEQNDKAYIFNNENWGLALDVLLETVTISASWEQDTISSKESYFKMENNLKVDDYYSTLCKEPELYQQLIVKISSDLFRLILKNYTIRLKNHLFGADGEQKNIIIFGLGEACRDFMLPLLKRHKIKPTYIIVNAKDNICSEFQGIKVLPVNTILAEEKKNILIIISSFTNSHKMQEQLGSLGFLKDQHFYCMIQRDVLLVKSLWPFISEEKDLFLHV